MSLNFLIYKMGIKYNKALSSPDLLKSYLELLPKPCLNDTYIDFRCSWIHSHPWRVVRFG